MCVALFQLSIGICFKPIQACTTRNELKDCGNVRAGAAYPTIYHFRGLLCPFLYHRTPVKDEELCFLNLPQYCAARRHSCFFAENVVLLTDLQST